VRVSTTQSASPFAVTLTVAAINGVFVRFHATVTVHRHDGDGDGAANDVEADAIFKVGSERPDFSGR